MFSELPEELWKQQVEVRIVPSDLKGVREIQFLGPDFSLRAKAIYRGKDNTTIHYEVKNKDTCLVAA